MVLWSHIELTLAELKYPSFESFWLILLGDLGVALFFTLSGFLITFLLLSEKKETNHISIKKFYIRRILRIWPLYFLIITLGLFILPNISFLNTSESIKFDGNFYKKAVLFLLILPNIVVFFFGRVPFISQTWSIGVEEQFYLIWPWLIKKLKWFLTFLILSYIMFLFYEAFPSIIYLFAHKLINVSMDQVIHFGQLFNFGAISIGSIGAFYYFNKNHYFLKTLHSNYVFILSLLALAILYCWSAYHIYYYMRDLFSFFFMIIIVYLATAPSPLINLNQKSLNYLGKISYGIYIPLYIYINGNTDC